MSDDQSTRSVDKQEQVQVQGTLLGLIWGLTTRLQCRSSKSLWTPHYFLRSALVVVCGRCRAWRLSVISDETSAPLIKQHFFVRQARETTTATPTCNTFSRFFARPSYHHTIPVLHKLQDQQPCQPP